MAKKKKSRKSARRSRQQTSARARQPKVQEQAASQAAAAVVEEKSKASKRKVSKTTLTDFAKEYSYVYYDLRKMFLVALVMFVLLIVANLVLTHLLIT